ncbi:MULTISPECIES: hypothetical protein [unclassified Streptomyces]
MPKDGTPSRDVSVRLTVDQARTAVTVWLLPEVRVMGLAPA